MKKNLQRFGASVLAAAMVAQSVALPAAAETTKIDSSVAQSVAASAASAASAVQSLPKFTSTADLIKQTAQTLAAQGEVHELEQDDAKLEATAQSKAGMSLAALENALADAMYANAAAGKINTEAYGLNKDEMASVMAATIKTYHLSSAVTDLGYETNAAGVVTAVTFTGSSGMTSAMESMTNSDDEVIAQQDDLFEEILTAHEAELKDFLGATPAELRSVHNLAKGVVEETNIRILIYEAAFSSMAVSGELDFFSYKVSLTPDQRSRCISYVLQLCKQREKLEFRLISGRIVNDFQYVADPNMFLSGAASYLRLDNNCPINRIAMVNNSVMEDRLSEYFDQVWNLDEQNVTKERNAIAEHIHHVLQGIHLITRAKSDEMEELQETWMNKI